MIKNLLQEMRRRKVFRAGITYLVSAWVLLEATDVLGGIFDLPDWTLRIAFWVLALGMPVALTISWFYEMTPQGFRRTVDLAPEDVEPKTLDRRLSVIIIALLAAGLGISIFGNFSSPPKEQEPLAILIANFDNQSGNPLFSGVLEDVLLVGLEVAPFVHTFPRAAATRIATEMKNNAGEPRTLDTETAMLVALQQGVNIVVGGTLSRAGGKLTLAISGISTGDQQEVFSASESVSSDTDILNAMVDISKNIRAALGNTEKRGGAGENESFTVTNLEAASEYLAAQDLQRGRKLEEAVVHYKKALSLDPDFARAYAGLALTEQYLGNSEAATESWRAALARLDRLTERERLRTLGNYFMINQADYEKALETYSSLVDKFPADNAAKNNLAVAAFYAMDFPRALEVGREVADRYPGYSGYAGNLALYAMYAGHFEEAFEVANDVIAMDSGSAYAFFVLASTSAVKGDVAAAEKTYRSMTQLGQFARSIGTEGLADLAVYNGKPEAAIPILDQAIAAETALNASQGVAIKQALKAEILVQLGDAAGAEAAVAAALELARGDFAVLVPAAMSLIQLGKIDEASVIADELANSLSSPKRAYGFALRALIASGKDNADEAITLANRAVSTMDLWLVRYIRAGILQKAGKVEEAQADLAICQQRAGEAIAVFLNDRPSVRMLRKLEASMAEAGMDSSIGVAPPAAE